MNKNLFFTIGLLYSAIIFSQVGINNDLPKAMLDVKSSNEATPAITDGILIPRVSTLSYSPGADQHSMMVYLNQNETYTKGTETCKRTIGFYNWDNNLSEWYPVSSQLEAVDAGVLLYMPGCRNYQIADAFSGILASDITLDTNSSAGFKKLNFANEIIDNYNSHDNATGVFTCRESGVFKLSVTLDIDANNISSVNTITYTDPTDGLQKTAEIKQEGALSLILGLIKVGATGDLSGVPSGAAGANTYVTRHTISIDSSNPSYSSPYSISTFVDLEVGEQYFFGVLPFNLEVPENVIIKSLNAGSSGSGPSTAFSLDRIK